MSKKCLITCEGGTGKSIMMTALMPEIRKKYEDAVYVVSPYYDVMKSCSYVTDAFPFGVPSIYESIKSDPDIEIIWKDPYNNSRFIRKGIHLFDAWRLELGLVLESEFDEYVKNNPDRNNISAVLDNVGISFPQVIQDAQNEVSRLGDHKFIIVQFTGGQSPLQVGPEYQNINEGIKRNYYRGQEIINELKRKYPEFTIIHYALPNEPRFQNTVMYQKSYLWYYEMLKHAYGVVTIDSSLLHMAASAVKDNPTLKVVSIWGETRPEHFGYHDDDIELDADTVNTMIDNDEFTDEYTLNGKYDTIESDASFKLFKSTGNTDQLKYHKVHEIEHRVDSIPMKDTYNNFANLCATGVVDTQPYFRPMGSVATFITFPEPKSVAEYL